MNNVFKDLKGQACFMRLPITDGVCEAPHYEPHARGKNWTALVKRDVSAPGGLDRQFLRTVRDRRYFYPTTAAESLFGEDTAISLKPGCVLEWGADYYTGSGQKKFNRKYAAVISISKDMLVTSVLYDSFGEADKHADDILQTIAEEAAADDALLAEFTADVIKAQVLTGPERALVDGVLALSPDRRKLVAQAIGSAVAE